MAPSTFKTRVEKFLGVEHTEEQAKPPSISNADIFIEHEPTVGEFLREYTPTFRDVATYLYNLFPFLSWIGKYNFIWFLGDFIAGRLLDNP